MTKPILCLDFDGVIHSYSSGWHGANFIPDPPVEGAIARLHEYVKHFEVHIYSSRSSSDTGREAMRNWLEYWLVKETETKIEALETFNAIHWPMDKPPAFLTIDDRAVNFNGDWAHSAWSSESLLAFRPWNKPAL